MKFSSFFIDSEFDYCTIDADSVHKTSELSELSESFDIKKFIVSILKPKYVLEMHFGVEFTFFNSLDKKTDLERIISTLNDNNIDYRIDKEAKHLFCFY